MPYYDIICFASGSWIIDKRKTPPGNSEVIYHDDRYVRAIEADNPLDAMNKAYDSICKKIKEGEKVSVQGNKNKRGRNTK
jgi:hypothetical protein